LQSALGNEHEPFVFQDIGRGAENHLAQFRGGTLGLGLESLDLPADSSKTLRA
jgi:hypothetical protein